MAASLAAKKKEAGQTKTTATKSEKTPATVRVDFLTSLLIAFVSGVLVVGFALGWTSQKTSLDPLELISFTLTVLLSGASIVLAISAIGLGRSSEQTIMQRSDDGLHLQMQIFKDTQDALSRIETSTGVTKERIDDLLAGKAGPLAQALATEMAPGKSRRMSEDRVKEVLERVVRGSSSSDGVLSPEFQHAQREAQAAHKAYSSFMETFLLEMVNEDAYSTIKVGEGSFGETGNDLFDGVFRKGDLFFATPTFSTSEHLKEHQFDGFDQYVHDVGKWVSEESNRIAIFVFDAAGDLYPKYKELFEGTSKLLNESISKRLYLVQGAMPGVAESVRKIVETATL
jgi:F0F1-type ATP synthase assembly protein I